MKDSSPMREAALRMIWRWLGYPGGLPLTNADIDRILLRHAGHIQASTTQMVNEQLVPQLNSIRAESNNLQRRRENIAATIMGGLCVNGANDTQRAVALADDLIKALR